MGLDCEGSRRAIDATVDVLPSRAIAPDCALKVTLKVAPGLSVELNGEYSSQCEGSSSLSHGRDMSDTRPDATAPSVPSSRPGEAPRVAAQPISVCGG